LGFDGDFVERISPLKNRLEPIVIATDKRSEIAVERIITVQNFILKEGMIILILMVL
jgi:hypothetical protein